MPAIESLVKKENIKNFLDEKNTDLFPLFRWIILSNRTHLILAPKELKIKELDSDITQYIMVSSNPEREAKFRMNKEKYGSFFAFHGSNGGNWHCILRNGLKNYSNSNKMSAGAAHGAGIYLAPQLGTSVGYMQPGVNTWENSQHKSVYVMSLCEIANNRSKYKDCGWCLVVKDEDIITTRYLLVWESNNQQKLTQNSYKDVSASSLTIPKMIKK